MCTLAVATYELPAPSESVSIASKLNDFPQEQLWRFAREIAFWALPSFLFFFFFGNFLELSEGASDPAKAVRWRRRKSKKAIAEAGGSEGV